MALEKMTCWKIALLLVGACASDPEIKSVKQDISAPGSNAASYPAALTDELIRNAIKQHAEGGFAASLAATVYNAKVSAEILELVRGTPRKWDPARDHVKNGGNENTVIYPVQVLLANVTKYKDGRLERERVRCVYHFYQSEFGNWASERWSHEVVAKEAD
jgi:hypothetical protein